MSAIYQNSYLYKLIVSLGVSNHLTDKIKEVCLKVKLLISRF